MSTCQPTSYKHDLHTDTNTTKIVHWGATYFVLIQPCLEVWCTLAWVTSFRRAHPWLIPACTIRAIPNTPSLPRPFLPHFSGSLLGFARIHLKPGLIQVPGGGFGRGPTKPEVVMEEDGDCATGKGVAATMKWSPAMEDAYQAALEHVGGLEAAKPKAVLELLQGQFPHLTIQNVKWHLLSHRRRQERHREMVPAGIAPPTKWNGRLEEVYEAEVARQGGLHAARPKALLDALQEQFPELTLQIVKWHLQGQRRREQRTGQDGKQPAGQGTGQAGKQAEGQVTALGGASGGQPSGSTGAPSAEAPTPAQQIPSEAAKAAPLVQHTPVLPPQPEEEQAEAEQAQEEQQAAEADSPQVDATPSPAKVASFKPDVFLEQLQALTQLPPQQLELLQHLLPASLAQAPQQQGQGQQRQQQQQQQQLAQQQQQPQAAHLLEDLQQLLTASLEQQMPQQQQGQQQQPPSVPLQLEDLQQQQLLTASLAQHHQQQQAQQHTPQLQQQQQAMAGVQGPLGDRKSVV